jgi:hypothetical protein
MAADLRGLPNRRNFLGGIMNQDFIVFAIIALTIFYIVFGFVKNLGVKKVKSGCGGCTGCDLSRIKKRCLSSVERIKDG